MRGRDAHIQPCAEPERQALLEYRSRHAAGRADQAHHPGGGFQGGTTGGTSQQRKPRPAPGQDADAVPDALADHRQGVGAGGADLRRGGGWGGGAVGGGDRLD